jgi:hypothetical protein
LDGPRKIRALLSGTPQKQNLVPENFRKSSSESGKDRFSSEKRLVGFSREVNLE